MIATISRVRPVFITSAAEAPSTASIRLMIRHDVSGMSPSVVRAMTDSAVHLQMRPSRAHHLDAERLMRATPSQSPSQAIPVLHDHVHAADVEERLLGNMVSLAVAGVSLNKRDGVPAGRSSPGIWVNLVAM